MIFCSTPSRSPTELVSRWGEAVIIVWISRWRLPFLGLMLIVVLSCAHGIAAPALPATPTAAESLELTPNAPETLWAVGDAATCRSHRDDAVASFLATRRGTIALLGDLAYEKGKPSEFRDCFDPLYGVLRERIRPAVGNHEYGMKGARGTLTTSPARPVNLAKVGTPMTLTDGTSWCSTPTVKRLEGATEIRPNINGWHET